MVFAIAITFLLGICSLFYISELTITIWVYLATIIVGVWYLFSKKSVIIKYSLVFLLAMSYALYQANVYLAKLYPTAWQNKAITVIGTITSLPNYKKDKVSFNFALEQIIAPKHSNINLGTFYLSWQTKQLLQIGQKWQFTVKVKKPRNLANIGSFDIEKYYFSQQIIASGHVLTKYYRQQYIAKQLVNPNWKLINFGYQFRQYCINNIMQALANTRFQGMVLALVTGVQTELQPEQLAIFRATGIAHLLAISGLHIGFIASISFWLTSKLWRSSARACLLVPAQIIAAYMAIIAAVAYGALAGFSLPTKRAGIMVILAMLTIILRRMLLAADIFGYSLLIILLLEPFAVLTWSFWLSFFAVAILLYAFGGKKSGSSISKLIKPGLVTSLGMMPLLLAGFTKVALIAPIANILAIPWISCLVIPAALLGVVIYPICSGAGIWLWQLAELLLQWLWPILQLLHRCAFSQWQPIIISPWYLLVMLLGILWLLAPTGFPGKIFACCGFLPLLLPIIPKVPYGMVKFTMLDVGQGLAVVVITRDHVLLYDTGSKTVTNFDAGEQVIWPFFQANNLNHIDTLIISHADLDHSGGMQAVLSHIMPQQILTPKPKLLKLPVVAKLKHRVIACKALQHWQWDGVDFRILHPSEPIAKDPNEQSCVLKIQTATASILLTGDIGVLAEQQLLAKKVNLAADIIVVPHHGSKNASTADFVTAVQAKYALASVGYLNQYQHPNALIVARYINNGAKFLDTVSCGAISFNLKPDSKQFLPNCYRMENQKLWSFKEYR